MTIKITDKSIYILNYRITLDDMINEMYYMFDIAHCNDPIVADSIYLSKLNQEDKDKFNHFKEQKLFDLANIYHDKKPIFNNNIVKYQLYNDKFFCLPIKTSINNYTNINCINDIMMNINIFYKTLKFKIKQERITKNIYKDLEIFNKRIIDLEHSFYNMTKSLKMQDKIIYKLCSIVEEKNIKFDNRINKYIDTADKCYETIKNDLNSIKKREIYLILFVIITTFINLII
jgi:hypothetical protein